MNSQPRIAIIGAGPIGLEAALYARLAGYDVSVYERGSLAENVTAWGHVRMFSPFGMNSSEWGRAELRSSGEALPPMDAILSGNEFASRYLYRIGHSDRLRRRIHGNNECLSISRRHQLKSDNIGVADRASTPMVLLLRNPHGERTVEADVVLDCSGTFGHPNPLGASGAACPGEAACADAIQHGLPDLQSCFVSEAQGDVLVVGAGYSAATTIVGLDQLQRSLPKFPLRHVSWVTRRTSNVPIPRIRDDSLVERDRLAAAANRIAVESGTSLEWIPGDVVQCLDRRPDGRISVVIESVAEKSTRVIEVNRIVANTGYRPDRTLYEELQVHECYATQGPMKLAARLLGETSADCLDQISHGPEVLRNPEPNFYILGMKSYGRRSNFLIQIGLQQIVDVFSLIEHDWRL